MNGRVEKGNASRKVSCKKTSKIKVLKIQKKKYNKDVIINISIIIISLDNYYNCNYTISAASPEPLLSEHV